MLGIAHRVDNAVDAMLRGDAIQALHDICSAIEATAGRHYGQGGKATYKRFLKDNLAIITKCGLGMCISQSFRIAYSHPTINSTDGLCSIEDILYHAVRCGLYHTTELPNSIRFIDERIFRAQGVTGTLEVPSDLIWGLIIAVVVCPANALEASEREHILNFSSCGVSIPLSSMWGQLDKLTWLLSAQEALNALRSRAAD